MRVSINGGIPKSSILVGFSIINHPAIGVSPFVETPICIYIYISIYIPYGAFHSHGGSLKWSVYKGKSP